MNNWKEELNRRYNLGANDIDHFIETEIIEKLIEDAAETTGLPNGSVHIKELKAKWLGKETNA